MSLTNGAARIAEPFLEVTCRALTALIIRSGGLPAQSAPPGDFVSSLRQLADDDDGFRLWGHQTGKLVACCAHYPQDRDDEACAIDPWPEIAIRLPELLAQSLATGQVRSHSPADGRDLSSLCHAIVRLRTLEARFAGELQRQKREAIYQLAYGLSHEFNNPLANIATRGGVLAQSEVHPQRKLLLENIVANAMRGCEMLGDLMLVARPPQLQLKPIRIDELVASVVDQSRRWTQGTQLDIAFDCHSQRELPMDASAMREALWALIRNALEAMLDGGTVEVGLSESVGRVVISVADTGRGLSPMALEHCFDPYYSGREAGRGLGLGLSKAQRIVDLHHGELTLTNRASGGAVASVSLKFS